MTKPFDPIALKIGRAYSDGLAAYKRGLAAYVEAGRLLIEKKAIAGHGKWEKWLKANAGALGFDSDRTAQKLMGFARENPTLTADLSETEVKELTRSLWGNGTRSQNVCNPTDAALADPQLESQQNYEWYTPPEHVALVKRVLGEIDLDPASCSLANNTVGAKKFYTKEQNGLTLDWNGRVYANVPFQAAIISPFADKLLDQLDVGNTTEAIFNCHTPTDMAWFHKLVRRTQALCLTEGRIRYIGADGKVGGSPQSGGAYFYFGRRPKQFAKVFGEIGTIVCAL